jgi:type I pantothenate kinase
MDQCAEDQVSPHRSFARAALRTDTPVTLTSNEVVHLQSLNDRLDIAEVEEIYLPLSRVLSLYDRAIQNLFPAQQRFLGKEFAKLPYIKRLSGKVMR